ncbi:hypothetical protein CLV78_102432 [Aliiruegeria haliotis]|uniref:Metal binding Ada-like protein n=1 Tax=Aliiruegeria haliotis TaxID=1280846 RepID=A0A2T0RVN8_9RHOB|nr:hypothetical protein [Aliiruegeria haliotis]PRY25255.1 hypothetical protein CLV78_102432 [Aliiruegeria haliotis]
MASCSDETGTERGRPRQNRVLPTGEIVAVTCRGTMMGNRGILHDSKGILGQARWRHKAWICCRLAFKKRQRQVMAPGQYTELFFLDEAVALAAGHRPCAECRREAYRAWQSAWARTFGRTARAPEMDDVLHRDRVGRDRRQIRHIAPLGGLPDGAFVLWRGVPSLWFRRQLRGFSTDGYTSAPSHDAKEKVEVLTPAATIAVMAAGYRPAVHPSAQLEV